MSTQLQTTPGTWSVDPIHSSASFSVKYLLVSTFSAGFKEIRATLESHGDHIHLEGAVPVESIDVDEPSFRAHLLGADFFDAENHPEILFTSTGSQVASDGTLELAGDLTIKGITNPVVATGAIAEITNPYGQQVIGLELETVIDRSAFELNWNTPLPSGQVALANDVKLTVQLQLKQAQA